MHVKDPTKLTTAVVIAVMPKISPCQTQKTLCVLGNNHLKVINSYFLLPIRRRQQVPLQHG
jgi:hypothetical protein